MKSLEKVRAYFSPCGIGLGHVGRCYPIAEELRRRGADVVFSTYLEGFDYVKKLGFPVASSPHLNLTADHTGKIDLRVSSVKQGIPALLRFLRQLNVEIEFMRSYRPDIVISDTRLSSVFAANLLSLPVMLILNQFQPIVPRSLHNFKISKIADGTLLTLIGRGWAASDLILIPDFPDPYTISLESLRIPKPYSHLVRHIGSILPRKPEDVEDTAIPRKEGQKLIFAAISGPSQERIPFISLLEPILESFPEEYKIVMSMGMPHGGSKPEVRGNLTLIPWISNRFEYLKACDLVISRAGHETIMQSVCYGKPQIIVPTPGHTEQYGNARRAKEIGVADAIHQQDVTEESLLTLIENVLNDDRYVKRLMEINSKNCLGDGVENAVMAVTELLNPYPHLSSRHNNS
jgi:uncharacterized protein (TIGR00661 family)